MFRVVSALCALLFAIVSLTDNSCAEEPIEFNRDIRPILSDRCFQCHGPDEKKREADLRLDLQADAKRDLGGYHAIVPGNVGQSELINRITDDDPDTRMPPAESGKELSAKEIETLKRWVDSGATFQKHWSFQKPILPDVPVQNGGKWPRNSIDHFVLSKLQSRSLQPSPVADPNTLIRRLSLDLTGLLPTPAEVDAFLADPSDQAYEELVDRLLNSKHYGERIGRHWLDLARYADSNGYANDGLRSVWPYRDWVIQALNDDMPFDQFTIEQIAGDMLPEPSESQLIATGFHRNTPLQTEGGSDAEQYRVERTKNRTDTTGAVWLGLTVGCAQCHTHKFDPITHQEYYQLYAFFNSVDEPTYSLPPSREMSEQLRSLREQLKEIDKQIEDEKTVAAEPESSVAPKWMTLEFEEIESQGGATLTRQDDGSILASGKNPSQDTYVLTSKLRDSDKARQIQSLRIETLTHRSLPKKGPGRAGNGNFVLAELGVTAGGSKVEVEAATADHSQKSYSVLDAFDGDFKTGWAINVSGGNMNVNRTAIFNFAEPATGELKIKMTTYEQGNGYNIGRLRVSVSEQKAKVGSAKESPLQAKRNAIQKRLNDLEKKRDKTLIMRERSKPRESFIQVRGDFLDRGATVKPATFTVLHPLKKSSETNPSRLDLANWLVSPENPLTARVQVNRMWQHLFGVGLVKTENDFGYQGSLPTHPELLDYLAVDFIRDGWSMKQMYKQIVMSATYRQASHYRDELAAVDPTNKWLGKQNRYRVEGEIVRDLGLSASGLLSTKMGGAAVFPPIPPNVIGTSSARHRWPTSKGEDRYRRGIYTAIYRANVYPMLLAFDGPDRDNACTRRSRSNTPLQALTIANDATFMEMAVAFGKQIVDSSSEKDAADDRIDFAFRAAFSRSPVAAELSRLKEYQQNRLAFYEANADETKNLVDDGTPELASWVSVARVIMNLDEFITRE